MTVSSETSRIAYNGNGSTTAFPTTFTFNDAADLVVLKVLISDGTETTLVLNSDYTVSGGSGSTGTVTISPAVSSSYRIVIYRDPPLTQAVDHVNNSSLNVESGVEAPLDKLTYIAQRLGSLVERSLRQPDGDASNIGALPASVTRASKYLAFDASGNPVASSAPTSGVVVSSFAATLLDDTTAGAVLTTLGISAFLQTLLDDADAATARTTLGIITPQVTVYTSGSGTYTPPTGARALLVRMAGGGAGGRVGGGTVTTEPGAGGDTTFGALTAGGAAGAGGAGGAASGGNILNVPGERGHDSSASVSGSHNGAGARGGATPFGGAGSGFYTANGGNAEANTGSGGGSGYNPSTGTTGGRQSGSAGGYVEHLYTSPAASYSYAVGAGGAGGTGSSAGGNGADGVIIVIAL